MPSLTASTPHGDISVVTEPGTVWRVGYRPDPWTFTPWQYAENGRFTGRWDDPDGNYRTLYTGQTLLGCLLEVLACFRPDPTLFYPAKPPAHWLMCAEVSGRVLVVPLAPSRDGDPLRCRPIGCHEATQGLATQYRRDR